MPITISDLAEKIADEAGIYGCGYHEKLDGGNGQDLGDNCWCRVCFVIGMTEKIRRIRECQKKDE